MGLKDRLFGDGDGVTMVASGRLYVCQLSGSMMRLLYGMEVLYIYTDVFLCVLIFLLGEPFISSLPGFLHLIHQSLEFSIGFPPDSSCSLWELVSLIFSPAVALVALVSLVYLSPLIGYSPSESSLPQVSTMAHISASPMLTGQTMMYLFETGF